MARATESIGTRVAHCKAQLTARHRWMYNDAERLFRIVEQLPVYVVHVYSVTVRADAPDAD